jgi:putative effector of murein hydrolase
MIKVMATICLGLVFSLMTTIFGVLAVQKLTGKGAAVAAAPIATLTPRRRNASKALETASKPAPAKGFSDDNWKLFWVASAVSGVLSVLATRLQFEHATLLQTIFLTFITGAAYIWSSRLPTAFVQVVHPLATSSLIVLVLIRALGKVTNVDYLDVLRAYKTGKLLPLHKTGAGDLLMFVLGPTVISFAIAVYGRKKLLFSNLPAVLTAMLVSSVGGLFGTAIFVRAINLGGKNGSLVRLSVLSRSVTTALALALTAMIGGDVSITMAVVTVTGIIGGSYAKPLLTYLGITDPLLRGLGIGSSSLGVGIASLGDEPIAFAFGAISMVLTAIAATTMASIPSIQKALIKTATGAPAP